MQLRRLLFPSFLAATTSTSPLATAANLSSPVPTVAATAKLSTSAPAINPSDSAIIAITYASTTLASYTSIDESQRRWVCGYYSQLGRRCIAHSVCLWHLDHPIV